MKIKSGIMTIFALSIIITFPFQAFSTDKLDDKSINTIHNFILDYYQDSKKGNADILAKYFLHSMTKIELQKIIDSSKIYETDRIEILEINLLSKRRCTVEVIVKELYKIENSPPPYLETLFKLKDTGHYDWKIMEISEPGLP